MNDNYTIRRTESPEDAKKLNSLFSQVFYPDEVGRMAETMFHHLPGMEDGDWFMAEEKGTGDIVSACSLLPWVWEMEGIRLKVAEMGLVGTLEEHRGQGLMRELNHDFDRALEEGVFDLAIIQGIPGFYQQFGYFYALPLENHISLPLHAIPEEQGPAYTFRLAQESDIPYLMEEDEHYRAFFSLSTFRDEAHWRYLLTESLKTEYASEYWIMERAGDSERFLFRIPEFGFGSGLIVSEVSETIPFDALTGLFIFCKQKAIERDKPYIRLNLHHESTAGKTAIRMGAKEGIAYAWQIKIPDPIRFLRTIGPVLERRVQESRFKGLSGTFRLDFYRTTVDLLWEDGALESVQPGEGESQYTLALNADLFPALSLGYRTWRELRHIRPDISPRSTGSTLLTEILFPSTTSWIYEQY